MVEVPAGQQNSTVTLFLSGDGGWRDLDPLGVPDILLMVSDAVVVFDNLAGKMHAIVLADPSQADAFEQGQASLEALLEKLRQPITPRRGLDLSRPPAADPVFRSSFTQDDYERAVDTISRMSGTPSGSGFGHLPKRFST